MSTVQRRVTRNLRWAVRTFSRAIAKQLLFQDLIHNPLSQIHAEAFSATNSLDESLLENELGHICSGVLDDQIPQRSVTLGCVRVHLVHNLRQGCTRDTFHGLFEFGPCARPQARYEIPVGKGVDTSMKQGRRSSEFGRAVVA